MTMIKPYRKKSLMKSIRCLSGFTIIEMLVVIVVIGILAAIGFVSYGGVQAKARDASVLSDLETMDALQTSYGLSHNTAGKAYYSESGADADLEFTPSDGNIIDVVVNETEYCMRGYNLTGTKKTINDAFTKESSYGTCIKLGPSSTALSCPVNFIAVPGSSSYGTAAFCLMKYEAKDVGGLATSQPSLTPWVNISQETSTSIAADACEGCHLITEAEWLTVAQNVLSVSSNWSNLSVDSGYIYSGHNDNNPANALVAGATDIDGYFNTGNISGNQKRTLTLTNGAVIWDLAGNVWEWTQGSIAANLQPGLSGEVANAWKEWNNSSLIQNGLPNNAMPSFTGLSNATNWDSTKGIGKLYSNYNQSTPRGYYRGGNYYNFTNTGILSLALDRDPIDVGTTLGFRVAK